MTLADLVVGQKAEILAVTAAPSLAQRLAEFGVFAGESVEFVTVAPLGDPLEFRVGETRVSLRKTEAVAVEVRPLP